MATFAEIPDPAEAQFEYAINFIAGNENVSFFRDLGNDQIQFRDLETGQFMAGVNVWQEFRDLIKEVGHS